MHQDRELLEFFFPTPYSLLPTPYSLFPVPCSLSTLYYLNSRI
ncbi:hypothetical protein [Moorena producens]|nr:hypothetical protein [Moorena producens]